MRIARSHSFPILITICLLLTACGQANLAPTPTPDQGVNVNWIQIFFTDPSVPTAQTYTGGPDERLVDAIQQARLSVDVAAYSLNLWSIRDALIDTHQRGVVVRMVMESDNMDAPEVQDLIAAGIPIVGDQRGGLMHDKFIVIDRSEVWTGSMNYTVSGAYKDNNNLVRLLSSQVAQDYTTHFEDMFSSDRFGPDAVADTPYSTLTVEGNLVEILFSPADGVEHRLLQLINNAQQSIDFLAYSFTSNDLGAALLRRADDGVTVRGMMDASQVKTDQGTEYDPFGQAGLDVRLDGNTEGLMHHKVLIIDRRTVVTGSYNFTYSADTSNDENVIILYDPGVAAQFLAEFQRIFEKAQPKYQPSSIRGNRFVSRSGS
jgi:phosphatidylserine/phosphatidylglycerophosphate/cardiolipin synthase-like enzyme